MNLKAFLLLGALAPSSCFLVPSSRQLRLLTPFQKREIHVLSNVANDNEAGDDQEENKNFDLSALNSRIQELKNKEDAEDEAKSTESLAALSQRIKEISKSQSVKEKLDRFQMDIDSGVQNPSLIMDLPVICFDALLPMQRLEARTQDPTFMLFMQKIGLGGYFMMVSLDFKSRKIRRNGCLCKIEYMDTVSKGDVSEEKIPTAVDFVIVGVKRCRLIGDEIGMKKGIGRWRRSYDPDGEEVVLGFGEERFLDVPQEHLGSLRTYDFCQEESASTSQKTSVEWDSHPIDVIHESSLIDHNWTEDITRIDGLVDEWYRLASDPKTYENLGVTAMTRVRKDAPILSVKPENLLRRVLKDLGPKPLENVYLYVFWAAALINPLPPLGVSFEIRGKMLECYDIEEQLQILERGVKRSIRNLTGEQPL